MIQFSAKGTNLLLVAQERGLVGEGVLISDGCSFIEHTVCAS